MGIIVVTKRKNLLKRIFHKLFKCPTFWSIKPSFTCPVCGKKYRCYWDGNDVLGFIDVCMTCSKVMDRLETIKITPKQL